MNTAPNSDPLLWEALPDLTLNIAQTAALCGISVRQLGYWTRQGYVTAQGQGARRTYGVEAIRRVLAIRKAMDTGASLRQSVRQVSLEIAPTSPALAPSLTNPAGTPTYADAILSSIVAFFQSNRSTRDDAGGLAVKLGWAEEDVRAAANRLCASGILTQNTCQEMTIFYRAG